MLHFARTMSDCLISREGLFSKLEPLSSMQYLAVKIQHCEAKYVCEWQDDWTKIEFLFMSGLGKGCKNQPINIGVSCLLFISIKYKEKGRLEIWTTYLPWKDKGGWKLRLDFFLKNWRQHPLLPHQPGGCFNTALQAQLLVTSNFVIRFIALSKLQIVQLFCHLL